MHELLTIQDLARIVRVPPATVRRWIYKRTGPPALKVGRHVRFRPADVERWLERRVKEPADRSEERRP